MANPLIEFDPVTHITAGALGAVGHRTFYLQAERGIERVTLLCEKEQVHALTEAIEEMVSNLEKEFGIERHESLTVDEVAMTIKEPTNAIFRAGAMGLGYDANRDRILLVAQEQLEDGDERDPREVRLFATRAQMQVLSSYARDTIAKGRTPEQRVLQAEVHFRRNGHDE